MLTAKDLAYMRDSIEELLPDTCNILSVTRTPDGQGGFTETWGTAVVGAACRLDRQQAVGRRGEIVSGAALEAYTGWVISLPQATAVNVANRIEISSSSYNVTSVDNGKSWSAVVRCAVEAT